MVDDGCRQIIVFIYKCRFSVPFLFFCLLLQFIAPVAITSNANQDGVYFLYIALKEIIHSGCMKVHDKIIGQYGLMYS